MDAFDLADRVLDGMAASMEAKFNARHPVRKIRYGSRKRSVGPKRQRGPFKRAKAPGSPTFASGFAKLNRETGAFVASTLRGEA